MSLFLFPAGIVAILDPFRTGTEIGKEATRSADAFFTCISTEECRVECPGDSPCRPSAECEPCTDYLCQPCTQSPADDSSPTILLFNNVSFILIPQAARERVVAPTEPRMSGRRLHTMRCAKFLEVTVQDTQIPMPRTHRHDRSHLGVGEVEPLLSRQGDLTPPPRSAIQESDRL